MRLLHDNGEGREVWLVEDDALTRLEKNHWITIDSGTHRGTHEGISVTWFAPGSQEAITKGAYTGRRWKQLEAERQMAMNRPDFMPYMIVSENVCQGTHWVQKSPKTARDHFVSEAMKESKNPEQGVKLGIFVELDNDRMIKDY